MKKSLIILLSLISLNTYSQFEPPYWRVDTLKVFKEDIPRLIKILTRVENRDSHLIRFFESFPCVLNGNISVYSDSLLGKYNYKKPSYKRIDGYLLGLLNLPDSTRSFVLNNKKTPLYVKAKLGDKRAEKELIKQFKTSIKKAGTTSFNIDTFNRLANGLLYVGSKKTMQAYVKGFRSRASYTAYSEIGNVEKSIFYTLLKRYVRYYNCEIAKTLLTGEEFVYTCDKDIRDRIIIDGFFNDFIVHIWQNHKVRIKVRAKFLVQGKDCDSYINAYFIEY